MLKRWRSSDQSRTPVLLPALPPGRQTFTLTRGRLGAAALVILAVAAKSPVQVLLARQMPTAPSNVRIVPAGTSPSSLRGPQASLTCPAGAVNIVPGTNIQTLVNSSAGRTTFCLKAGIHSVRASITPKTGNTFVGEYGAILDGTGWTSTDLNTAVIKAMNVDVDDVTIRNLVIRNFPQVGILAFRDFSDRWTIDHVEVGPGKRGVLLPNDFVLSNSYIHHNVGDVNSENTASRGGGYGCYLATRGLFLNNEIAYNGPEQKCMHGNNVTWRGNYLHHNLGNGIWFDGDNPGFLVEDNIFEDNPTYSVFIEISESGVIRNNTIRRAGWGAINISTSRNVEVYGNRVENGWRGIGMFLTCSAVGGGWAPTPNPEGVLPWDLRDVNIHDNVTILGPQSDAIIAQFSSSGCTAQQLAPYQNGSKNLRFQNNRYVAPNTAGSYWLWWDSLKTWSQWQALGADAGGAVSPS